MDYQKITVVLIGNATHDAAIKQAEGSEKLYGNFNLAVRNKQGETTYFPIRCFGKLAAGLTAMKKGTKVFVEGELEIAAFTGEEGGKRMTYRVLATTYRSFGNGRRVDAGEANIETESAQADQSL